MDLNDRFKQLEREVFGTHEMSNPSPGPRVQREWGQPTQTGLRTRVAKLEAAQRTPTYSDFQPQPPPRKHVYLWHGGCTDPNPPEHSPECWCWRGHV